MATYKYFDQFVEDLCKGVHNLGTDQLVVALCPAANTPLVTNTVLGDLTTIDHTNLGAATVRNITTTSCDQTDGTVKLILADLTLTATATVPKFRFVVIYNDGTTGATNPLICWYDYGGEVEMKATETFKLDFNASNGLLSIAPTA
jgi:hypothetical protein